MSSREGSLEAPTRHPPDWKNPAFYDKDACFTEMARVFDICQGCRRCRQTGGWGNAEQKSLAARSSLFWAVCSLANPRHSGAMAVLVRLAAHPKPGRPHSRGLFQHGLIAHRRLRSVHLGEHLTLQFEDEHALRRQIQEMLFIEKIVEEAGIQSEIEA